jgi:hypothetical protein
MKATKRKGAKNFRALKFLCGEKDEPYLSSRSEIGLSSAKHFRILVLPGSQHDQCTCLNWLYTVGIEQFLKFRVFCTWIENHTFGLEC